MQQQILEFLKKNENYISGEEISKSLNISRAAIWKYIQDLRQNGYDIIAVPHLGYKLNSCPDKLFSEEIHHQLGTKNFGKKIVFYETVDSTMDAAFQMALKGCPEGTVICAEGQTKGRGRLGRGWTSPKGKGIYVSVVLRPALPPSEVAQLTLLSAVAVAQAVKENTGVVTAIKWPNDLLVNHRKVAGILTELNAETDLVKFVIVGIGVNVNTALGFLPRGATSLKVEAKKNISRVHLLQEILRNMEKWYLRFQKEGFQPIILKWKEGNATLNKRIRISDLSGYTDGVALDIDQDGGLLIRQDSGIVVKKMTGDVVLVR